MFLDREPKMEEYGDYVVAQCEGQKSALYRIKAKQGKVPAMLEGMYTSLRKACDQIDAWNRAKAPRMSKASAKD